MNDGFVIQFSADEKSSGALHEIRTSRRRDEMLNIVHKRARYTNTSCITDLQCELSQTERGF